MKRFMLPVVVLTLLTGCSKSENGELDTVRERIPIQLNSGIREVTTRAAINTDDEFAASIVGWETDGTIDYSTKFSWSNETTITASTSIPGNTVTLIPTRYYAANDNVKTYIKGWHPVGTPSNGRVTFNNTDGTIDAMISSAINGSKKDSDNKNLVFEHPTTQIKFEVQAGTGLEAGTTIKSISIQEAQLPIGFDLTDNSVIYDNNPIELTVPGISEVEITTDPVAIGEPIMIKPFDNQTMTVNVETSTASFKNVTVTIDDDTKFLPGKAYTVTLTFQQKEILLKAAVTAWNDSGTGAATIE